MYYHQSKKMKTHTHLRAFVQVILEKINLSIEIPENINELIFLYSFYECVTKKTSFHSHYLLITSNTLFGLILKRKLLLFHYATPFPIPPKLSKIQRMTYKLNGEIIFRTHLYMSDSSYNET